jgi:DNA-binding transcriptional ArsR family regulator
MISGNENSHVGNVLRALGDPTRRAIYERLVEGEASIARLTEQVRISQPAVSQHVALLRTAGLLHERKQGRSTLYRAASSGLTPLVDWIGRQQTFWRSALDRLDTFLEEDEQ